MCKLLSCYLPIGPYLTMIFGNNFNRRPIHTRLCESRFNISSSRKTLQRYQLALRVYNLFSAISVVQKGVIVYGKSEHTTMSKALTTKVESGSPYQLSDAQTLKASSALLKYVGTQQDSTSVTGKKNLLDDADAEGENEKESTPIW